MVIFNSYVKLPEGSEFDEFPSLKIPRRVSSDTKNPAYAGLPKGSCRISSRQELVGGDWNHGILNDFPETVGNFIIPTDFHSLIPSFFRGVGRAQPPTRECCRLRVTCVLVFR